MDERPAPPKRSLGQNFLVDRNIQRKIVAELGVESGDVVLEVGPGHGELSHHLVGRCRRLVLIEKDRDLAEELRDRWRERDDVAVLEADALGMDLSESVTTGGPLRIISNVPYNITSPLIFAFLAVRPPAVRIVLTVQREVAERVVASPGNKTYGALSVGVQAVSDVGLAFRVGRQSFRPVPDVESAVLRIEPRADAADFDSESLRVVTRAFFNRRRKQVQKILRSAPELGFTGDPIAFLGSLDVDPGARPETLAPGKFVEIAGALARGAEGLRPR